MLKTRGRIKVALGILCFAALLYWVMALNVELPGSYVLRELYSQRQKRRGPWGFWVLTFGGIGLVYWGLRDQGVVPNEDETS